MKIKKKAAEDKFLACDVYASITFKEYSDRMPRYTKNQIRSLYNEVFQKDCICDIVWAKYQISYELARQQYIKDGNLGPLAPGSQFRKAYEGTMRCDLSSTGETLKTLIPFELKNSQEINMKKDNKVNAIKKAAAVKAANRVGLTLKKSVPETWVHVFIAQSKNKWTDEKISEFMHQEFPDLKNKAFDQVAGCRNHYNNGGYTKGVKPVTKAVRYDADGSVIKRTTNKVAPVAKKAESAPESARKAPVKKVLRAKRPAPVAKKSTPAVAA